MLTLTGKCILIYKHAHTCRQTFRDTDTHPSTHTQNNYKIKCRIVVAGGYYSGKITRKGKGANSSSFPVSHLKM